MNNLRQQGKRQSCSGWGQGSAEASLWAWVKSWGRFYSCWLSVGFRRLSRLRQLPNFCIKAVESPVLPWEQVKGKVWRKKEQVAKNYLSIFGGSVTKSCAGISLNPDKHDVGKRSGSILVFCCDVCSCDYSFMVRQKVGWGLNLPS